MVRLWLIFPPDEVKAGARAVQESFRELDWVAGVPDSYLHVSAGPTAADWEHVSPFPITYRRANCFHDAAIIEAHADGGPFPWAPFLPHLSVGYFRRPERADRLRDALLPLRHVELGEGVVDEVHLCDVPIAKSRFFEPWRVVRSIRLEG
jgi:hypothetical protein